MVRALWSGASGMMAQQTNVDTIANNLANVNTVGYKTEQNEFKSLLYQSLQTRTTTANGINKPVNAQVGLGVRNASITSEFTQGAFQASESSTSFAVSGEGFFALQDNGETYYTRNGDFHFALGDGNALWLTNSDGMPVLNTTGQPITIPADYIASKVQVTADGQLTYPDDANNQQPIAGMIIGMFQFQNPSGLFKVGGTMYQATENSGEAINEATNPNVKKSEIRQGYLESSNVQVADEMVNLIIAQRAYELNSKVITTSDQMLQTANELKR